MQKKFCSSIQYNIGYFLVPRIQRITSRCSGFPIDLLGKRTS